MLRHVALNLLKNETTAKVGVKNKRLKVQVRLPWGEAQLVQNGLVKAGATAKLMVVQAESAA